VDQFQQARLLAAGTQTLRVTFTPTNTTNYSTATGSVQLIVNKATPTITWATPAPITYGTALSTTQLNATASVPGTFVYNPAAGTVLAAGTQTLNVTFTPTNTTNYTTATGSVQLTVNNALTLTSISVTPQTVSLPIGATQQFTATGTYSDGSNGNITSSATWTSSDVSVATISATGIATGVAEGPTTITATVGAIYGSASLTGTQSPFTFTGSLNTARIYHTTTLLQNGKVLITGGYVGGGDFTGTSELYDPVTGNFTPTGSLIIPRSWHSATLLQNGQVLIAGGEATDSSGNGYQPTEAELYDPATGLFSYTGSLNIGRSMHSATLLQNGMVLIAGGSGDATAELYDPAAGTFTYTGSLNASIENQSATLLNDDTVLLAGGDISFSSSVAGAEIYNPTTGTFTATGSLKAARSLHTATLLSNGKVLIATGYNLATDLPVATAELYDPVAKAFTVTGSSVDARYYSTGTLLNNGQVLIVGGLASNDATSELSPAELYDPTSGTFSLAGNLNMARYSHSAALLNNGTVLIAAGESPFSFLNTAEIYDPSGVAPPPAYLLQITPAVANVVVGGTQSFTAVDNHGYPRQDVTWTVDNSSLASVTSNENAVAVLTGLDAGLVTLTATDGTSSAQEQVTILAAGAYPAGTVIWSVPPVSGYSAQQIVQAVPTAWGPDLYSIQLSADGTQSIVQAFKADGEQMWQTTLPVLNNNSVPDGYGGLIVTEYDTCTPGQTHPLTVVQLDPVYGQPVSEVQAAGVQGRNGIVYCYTGGAAMAPQIAVRGDGAVFMTEPTNNGFPQITGPVGNYWIPLSSITDIYGTVVYVQCCVGPPMVNSDGTTYLEYEVRNNSYTRVISDTLYLMQINPDNTSSSTVLSATTQNETQLPGPIIPDGQGGVLATWTVSPANAPVPQYPYQAVDVVAGVVGTPYNLPFSPASTSFGKSPTLVLGENGVAFASGPTTTTDGMNTAISQIVSFNITSGAPIWTYQEAQGNTLSLIAATAGNGLVARSTDQNGADTVLRFDATGATSAFSRVTTREDASALDARSNEFAPADTWTAAGYKLVDFLAGDTFVATSLSSGLTQLISSGSVVDWAKSFFARPEPDNRADPKIQIDLRAYRICAGISINPCVPVAPTSDADITARITNAHDLWWSFSKGQLQINWDKTITPFPACPASYPNCTTFHQGDLAEPCYDITATDCPSFVNYALLLFPIRTGSNVLFADSIGNNIFGINMPLPNHGGNSNLTFMAYDPNNYLNVLAHELGHQFSLPDLSTGLYNLMGCFFCGLNPPASLSASQIEQALKGAKRLAK
jgi:uncharacterized protein YjdB